MLEQLMNKIQGGGSFELADLAVQLGTSKDLVAAMLDHLQRAGLLQPYQGCDDACGACNLKGACSSGTHRDNVRLWQESD